MEKQYLDKRSKIILNTIIKRGFLTPNEEFKSIKVEVLPFLPNKKKYGFDFGTVSTAVTYLIRLGYLEGMVFYDSMSVIPDFKMLYVTQKGCRYKELCWIDFKETMFKSVFVPIVVSVITTLLTLIIKYIYTIANK